MLFNIPITPPLIDNFYNRITRVTATYDKKKTTHSPLFRQNSFVTALVAVSSPCNTVYAALLMIAECTKMYHLQVLALSVIQLALVRIAAQALVVARIVVRHMCFVGLRHRVRAYIGE